MAVKSAAVYLHCQVVCAAIVVGQQRPPPAPRMPVMVERRKYSSRLSSKSDRVNYQVAIAAAAAAAAAAAVQR